MAERNYSEITPEIRHFTNICVANDLIDKELYTTHKVFRGLRDLNGNGILTGLTEISEIVAKQNVDGNLVPCEGTLFYRGYNVRDLVKG